MIFLAAVSLLAWLYLAGGHGAFWRDGERLSPARPASAPPVAVVVPARDEADSVAASIGSLLRQDYPGPLRVVLVDDGSTDATAAIARTLPGADRLTVLAATPRPPGWAGKLWAVHQGVCRSEAEFLFLTDADIEHDPAHLAALVAQAERTGADMVSEMGRLGQRASLVGARPSGPERTWSARWWHCAATVSPSARWCRLSSICSRCFIRLPGSTTRGAPPRRRRAARC